MINISLYLDIMQLNTYNIILRELFVKKKDVN